MKTRTMMRTQAELLLAAVIIARSTSYVLTKVGLQDMGKFTLLAVPIFFLRNFCGLELPGKQTRCFKLFPQYHDPTLRV